MTGAVLDPDWAVEFDKATRAAIEARDTPPGRGRPVCVVCGLQSGPAVHIHHRRYRSRQGDGRPSNGIVVCGAGHGGECHTEAVHREAGAAFRCSDCGWQAAKWMGRCPRCRAWGTVECESPTATAQGWVISRHGLPPGCYRTPLLCAWRGWIILTDIPGKSGLLWRPATAVDMARDYSLPAPSHSAQGPVTRPAARRDQPPPAVPGP